MNGFVYLIGELDNKNNYKIGFTKKDVNERIKELQTGSSEELYLHSSFKSSYPNKLEKMLHRHFQENKKINEWFVLNEEQTKDFIKTCEKYETVIKDLSDNPFFNKKKRIF